MRPLVGAGSLSSMKLPPLNPPARRRRLIPALFLPLGLAALASAQPAPEFQSLFNGSDLTGWSGLDGYWSVRDGAITGRTTAEMPLKTNTFLVWRDEVANFEFRAKFRLSAENPKHFSNSGVQYRSRIIDPAKWIVGGYQADMDADNVYTGQLYEERGRGIVVKPGERILIGPLNAAGKPQLTALGAPTDPAAIKATIHPGEWNDLVIITQGNHLRHWVNGLLTAEAIDLDETKGAKSGVLALQLHAGAPMTAQFKDIMLKVLPP
jgi:hypothetical protein